MDLQKQFKFFLQKLLYKNKFEYKKIPIIL